MSRGNSEIGIGFDRLSQNPVRADGNQAAEAVGYSSPKQCFPIMTRNADAQVPFPGH